MEWLVRTYSNEGEIVLDPFMGSGVTGIACINSGRKFIGIEIEKRWFDVACKRVEQTYNEIDNNNERIPELTVHKTQPSVNQQKEHLTLF